MCFFVIILILVYVKFVFKKHDEFILEAITIFKISPNVLII